MHYIHQIKYPIDKHEENIHEIAKPYPYNKFKFYNMKN